MRSPVTRVCDFLCSVSWLSAFTSSALQSALYLLKMRGDRHYVFQGTYDGAPLYFSGKDSCALKEVLVDDEYAFLAQHIETQKPLVILDIGAHIGTFARWCWQKNKAIQIYCVEADPQTFKVLQKNVLPFGSHALAMNYAASSRNAPLSMKQFDISSMSNRVSEDGEANVMGITAESLLEQIHAPAKIDILKIDIEGSEEEFLCAPSDLLERAQMLVIEMHPDVCDTDKVRSILEQHFSSIKDVKEGASSKPLLLCTK